MPLHRTRTALLHAARTWQRSAPVLVPTIVALGVLAAALLTVGSYRFQVNPDGVSYVAIAQHWLDGRWGEALNAYWGPLFSWLLVPFLAAGVDGLLAAKELSALIAAATVVPLWLLLGRVSHRLTVRTGMLLAAVPLLLWWSAYVLTPDSLVVLVALAYACVALDPRLHQSRRLQVALGALGAVGYLAKSYFLPLFLAHATLVHLLGWWRQRAERPAWVRAWLVATATFVLAVAPWVVAISIQQGALTIGTSAAYNVGLVGPANPTHPMHRQGLLEPSRPGAMSVWEDPSDLRFPAWPDLRTSVAHVWGLVRTNAALAAGMVLGMAGIVGALLVLAVAVLLDQARADARTRALGGALLLLVVFPLGYLPLLVEERYIWPCFALVLVVAAGVLERLFDRLQVRGIVLPVLVLLTAWSFAVRPYESWVGYRGVQADLAATAEGLGGTLDLRGARVAAIDDWHRTLYLCYHLRCGAYLGTPRDTGSPARVLEQLREHRVDTLLVWGSIAWDPAELKGFHPVVTSTPGAPAIYRSVP